MNGKTLVDMQVGKLYKNILGIDILGYSNRKNTTLYNPEEYYGQRRILTDELVLCIGIWERENRMYQYCELLTASGIILWHCPHTGEFKFYASR